MAQMISDYYGVTELIVNVSYAVQFILTLILNFERTFFKLPDF
jgi:hypothetical protein